MFKIIIVTICVALICNARAFPQTNPAPGADAQATLLSSTFADDGAGNFNSAFESSNGIKQQSSGQLKDVSIPTYDAAGQKTGEEPGKAGVQTGSFSYTAPDGSPITLDWIAGK